MATLVKGMPRNRFETTDVISRELNFSRSSLGSARRTALRIVSGPSRPKTMVLVTPARDRKSTRLNSSHGYISYAVFCLKKKKKTNVHLLQYKKKKKNINS